MYSTRANDAERVHVAVEPRGVPTSWRCQVRAWKSGRWRHAGVSRAPVRDSSRSSHAASTARGATIPANTATRAQSRPRLESLGRRRGVVAAFEGGIGGQRADRPFEPDDAVRPRLRGPAVATMGSAKRGWDRPLERLLRAHREADDGAQMRHLQLVVRRRCTASTLSRMSSPESAGRGTAPACCSATRKSRWRTVRW